MPGVLDRASRAIDEVADAIADALAPERRSR
jgi:hypothetical protein